MSGDNRKLMLIKKVRSLASEKTRWKQGYTLVEALMAFMIISLLTVLALSSLLFFNQLQDLDSQSENANQRFEKIHLFFQRQIEVSETICVKDGKVYLQDMETSRYYNYYELNPAGMLYRIKTTAKLKPIGSGEASQFEKGIQSFSLTALSNETGAFSGVFRLNVIFADTKEKHYETYITYPGGSEKIIMQ